MTDNDPVVQVGHADALAFGDWLTKRTGLTHRLPTEVEWNWAARGGESGDFFLRFAKKPAEAGSPFA